MAAKPKSPGDLKAGTIASFVYHHMSRGKTTEEIMNRAINRFGRENVRYITKEIDYWSSYKLYGIKLKTMSDNANLKNMVPPTRTGGTTYIRMRIVANFDDPSKPQGERRRPVMFSIDVAREGTLGKLKDLARLEVMEWAKKFYGMTHGESGRRVRNVEIEGIETL